MKFLLLQFVSLLDQSTVTIDFPIQIISPFHLSLWFEVNGHLNLTGFHFIPLGAHSKATNLPARQTSALDFHVQSGSDWPWLKI